METCVIYVRVSTKNQEYTRQISELKRYAKYKKIKIEKIFEEKISGYVKDRPEFEKMLKYIKEQKIKLIMCTELSRFGRNTSNILQNIDQLKEKGVNVYFLDKNVNTISDDPTSKLVIGTLSLLADLERDNIKQRMASGKLHAIKSGNRVGLGVLPYGFKANKNKILLKNTEEAKWVVYMYKAKARGTSLHSIADHLNTLGVKTRFHGKRYKKDKRKIRIPVWGTNNLTKILKSKLYKGIRVYKKKQYKLQGSPIVSEELWNKVQETFKTNVDRLNKKKKGLNKDGVPHYEFLLAGKLFCGRCNWKYGMGSRTERRFNKSNSFYWCYGRRQKNYKVKGGGKIIRKCDNGQFKAQVLDDTIYTMLTGNPTFIDKILEESSVKYDINRINDSIKEHMENIKILEKSKDPLFYEHRERLITNTVFREKIDELNAKIEAEKKLIIAQETKRARLYEQERERENRQKWIQLMFRDVNKRAEIEKYVDKIVVYKVDNVDFDWTKLPKLLYDKTADMLPQELRYNRTPNPYNDKTIYLEMFAFGLLDPFKCIITNVSKNFYCSDKLKYSEIDHSVSIRKR